ncbi:hypothetical protein EHM76_00460 [bacterium]|nr:MAG: hypothetical protein EHM76_00460 [bacterium]
MAPKKEFPIELRRTARALALKKYNRIVAENFTEEEREALNRAIAKAERHIIGALDETERAAVKKLDDLGGLTWLLGAKMMQPNPRHN